MKRTIKYICYRNERPQSYDLTKYEIIKYKCPYNTNVYFYTFPPLYENQGRTTYKTIKKKQQYK